MFSMSLHPAGNIQLRVSHRPVDLQPHPTLHTSHTSMAEIQSFISDRVISKGLWPPRSPDLTPPDCYLWGYLKGTVYQNKPRTIDALKANITKKFRQWQRTYWQEISKIWSTGFNPVWTQMVATSITCYDVVTFPTQRMYSCSNLVAISSLVSELLKKCRVW